MELRDILLFLRAGASNAPALQLATGWAQAYGAAATGCCLCADPPPSIAESFVRGQAGVAQVVDHRLAQLDSATRPVEAEFRAAAAAAGIVADWTVPDPCEPAESLAQRARFFDLAIVPRAAVSDHPAREVAEHLALRSGAPCVIAPMHPLECGVERVVIAWNGSAQARRAMDDALPFLKAAKAVQLLVLGDSEAWLDHCSPELVVRRLARHDVDASLRIVSQGGQADGADLAGICETFGADLLVMGAYSRARASELVLGGATRAVLADFPIPVLMSR